MQVRALVRPSTCGSRPKFPQPPGSANLLLCCSWRAELSHTLDQTCKSYENNSIMARYTFTRMSQRWNDGEFTKWNPSYEWQWIIFLETKHLSHYRLHNINVVRSRYHNLTQSIWLDKQEDGFWTELVTTWTAYFYTPCIELFRQLQFDVQIAAQSHLSLYIYHVHYNPLFHILSTIT